MKRYTYSLYDLHGNKTKTVTVTSDKPVAKALETYITTDQLPQFIYELNIMLEKIEDCDDKVQI